MRLSYLFIFLVFFACKNSKKPPDKDVVNTPEQLEERTAQNLKKVLGYALENNSRINDSVSLTELGLLNTIYKNNNFKTIWSHEDKWLAIADSLYHVVNSVKEYGLFPDDYNHSSLETIRNIIQTDSVSRRDAALWTRADVLLTEAYLSIAKHLRKGRLQPDSVTQRKDSLISDSYFLQYFNQAIHDNNIITSLQSLEPKYPQYQQIRQGMKRWLASADFKRYTYLQYPFKDSLAFIQSLKQRLKEEGFNEVQTQENDSLTIAATIQKYQLSKNVKLTGKVSESLVRSLNNTDTEKFKSIAVTLDSYKLMSDTVPKTYILVNLPSYTLYVYKLDTLVLESKVIVGSPKTKTPLLNSRVSNFITFPQWTVPYSIIFKEMLPRIQKNISYLDKENLMVVDKNDSVIDPRSIDWAKLNKNRFPYLLRQRQGDDNSLGIIKFNFPNKYSVYLHDTNARWLFNKSARALSHGCVRVKEWEELSRYLTSPDTLKFPSDSLAAWIDRKEKHTVTGFPRVPLFIRYFTVEGKDGKLTFHNDIYGYERLMKTRYFGKRSMG